MPVVLTLIALLVAVAVAFVLVQMRRRNVSGWLLGWLRQAYQDAGRDADAAVISRALADAERRAGARG